MAARCAAAIVRGVVGGLGGGRDRILTHHQQHLDHWTHRLRRCSAILGPVIRAVVLDLDGVLIDSEQLWDQARREVVARHNGRWRAEATAAMQGMSSPEWSRYLRDALGVDLSPERIAEEVVANLLERYQRGLPLIPGALEAVRRIGQRWPLGLASSANRVVIDEVLAVAGLRDAFAVTVSSEEVPRGKPAPDVYLEAARRLGEPPSACAAVEDSANGIRSAVAAGLHAVAIPNRDYPPPADALAGADLIVESLSDLTLEAIDRLGRLHQCLRPARCGGAVPLSHSEAPRPCHAWVAASRSRLIECIRQAFSICRLAFWRETQNNTQGTCNGRRDPGDRRLRNKSAEQHDHAIIGLGIPGFPQEQLHGQDEDRVQQEGDLSLLRGHSLRRQPR